MSNQDIISLILLLAGVLLLTRTLPVTLFGNKQLPVIIEKWLKYIPPSILAALVASEIVTKDGNLYFSFSNLYLIVAVPTFLIAYKTKSLFTTLVLGMGIMALLRLGLQYV